MAKTKNHDTSCIQMEAICLDKQCLKNCLETVLNRKKIVKLNEEFIKHYNEDSDKGQILEADVEYPKNLHDLHSDLALIKINKNEN